MRELKPTDYICEFCLNCKDLFANGTVSCECASQLIPSSEHLKNAFGKSAEWTLPLGIVYAVPFAIYMSEGKSCPCFKGDTEKWKTDERTKNLDL